MIESCDRTVDSSTVPKGLHHENGEPSDETAHSRSLLLEALVEKLSPATPDSRKNRRLRTFPPIF